MLERLTTPGFDMLCGEARSPVYDAIHTRRIFFIAGKYWLIVDSLRGLVPHKFDLRFHLTAAAWNHCTRIDRSANTGIRTPELVLLFEPQREPVLSKGWVSKSYGIKEVAPVVSVVASGSENADFYTLIAPLKLTSPLPQFQAQSTGSDAIIAGHVRVQWNEKADDITWSNKTASWSHTPLAEGVTT